MTNITSLVVTGDLDSDLVSEMEREGKEFGLAVDVETTGLNPQIDRIEVVSLATPNRVVIVPIDSLDRPHYLATLLANNSIEKILHHAVFDLSFMYVAWKVEVLNVFCTKVAARIAGIHRNPTLQYLAAELLEVQIDKSERVSDWSRRPLSPSQISYAGRDVAFLHQLRQKLAWRVSDQGYSSLFEACMKFVSARVELGLMRLDDVFSYQLAEIT